MGNGKGSSAAIAPKFKEQLPAECPPNSLPHLTKRTVIRFIPAKPALPEHFESYASQGEPLRRGVCPCAWASCSVFVDTMKPEQIAGLLKFPKLRNMKFQAFVDIDATSGMGSIKASGHIDLWMYESFDPVAAVAKYEPCP